MIHILACVEWKRRHVSRVCNYVWWLTFDKAIEAFARQCKECQMVRCALCTTIYRNVEMCASLWTSSESSRSMRPMSASEMNDRLQSSRRFDSGGWRRCYGCQIPAKATLMKSVYFLTAGQRDSLRTIFRSGGDKHWRLVEFKFFVSRQKKWNVLPTAKRMMKSIWWIWSRPPHIDYSTLVGGNTATQ